MKDRILASWGRLGATSQRVLSVGAIFTALVGVIAAVSSVMPNPEPPKTDKQSVVRHILTDTDPRSLGIDGLAAQLRTVNQHNEEMTRRLAALEEEQKRQQLSDEERLERLSADQNAVHQEEIASLRAQIDNLNKPNAAPASEVLPAQQKDRAPKPTPIPKPASDLDSLFAKPPAVPYGGVPPAGAATGQPAGAPGQKQPLSIRIIKQEGPKTSNSELVAIAQKAGNREEDVFIPAGTLLSGNLLNGLDAQTGKSARKEPYQVMARLKDEAILPNRFKADVRECMLVSSGYGDISAERAYIRAETLSCVRDDGGVIEVPIDAYAVGEDGKLGLRGRVVSKQGALLANALAAGFLRGFSDAFGRSQTQVLALAGPAGVATTPFQQSFSQAGMEGGALRGAGYAMDRLSHFYMDLAEETFPVIEIDTTRRIEFVVQRGTSLKLHNANDPTRTASR